MGRKRSSSIGSSSSDGTAIGCGKPIGSDADELTVRLDASADIINIVHDTISTKSYIFIRRVLTRMDGMPIAGFHQGMQRGAACMA